MMMKKDAGVEKVAGMLFGMKRKHQLRIVLKAKVNKRKNENYE